mmetsp:Transcript_11484/g.22862  ORF Transcript_11484/g.22862 Transcript_11484/m.22862 type:complete len:146 (+) Transcript_11484:33-470(+)
MVMRAFRAGCGGEGRRRKAGKHERCWEPLRIVARGRARRRCYRRRGQEHYGEEGAKARVEGVVRPEGVGAGTVTMGVMGVKIISGDTVSWWKMFGTGDCWHQVVGIEGQRGDVKAIGGGKQVFRFLKMRNKEGKEMERGEGRKIS